MTDPPTKERKRAKRRPNVRALITDVERAGKQVTSVTVDGVTLRFEEPVAENRAEDEVENWIKKRQQHAH